MILDALLQLSGTVNPTAGQDLAQVAGTYTSTNVIDLAGVGTGNTARDIGMGEDLRIEFIVNTAFTGGTSLQPILVCADNAAISTNVTQIAVSPAILLAKLTAGAKEVLHVNRAAMGQIARRYLAIQYVIVGDMTAGTMSAFMLKDVQDSGNNTLFNSGFSVS